MFTGIVEELGTVAAIEDQGDALRLTVRATTALDGAVLGDSIAVNGCCLTVAATRRRHLDRRRHAGDPRQDLAGRRRPRRPRQPRAGRDRRQAPGRPPRAGPRRRRRDRRTPRSPSEHWDVVEVSLPADLASYVVPKGSICVDGVSLTVVDVGADSFTVSLIPETLARTTLGTASAGRPRQPRDRRDRPPRREAASPPTSQEPPP